MACQIACTQYVKEKNKAAPLEPHWVDAPKGLFDEDKINLGDSRTAFLAIQRGSSEVGKLFDMQMTPTGADLKPRRVGESLWDWFPLKDFDIESLPCGPKDRRDH